MNRRQFLAAGAVSAAGLTILRAQEAARRRLPDDRGFVAEHAADLVICGGGLGGVAAALAACRNGLRVILTEETDWIGGQLTSQAVPPDEHRWIEQFGCTRGYRALRDGIRDFYRRHYPLTEAARARWNLNPGLGAVSRLCHEPRVALAVMEALLAPHLATGRLTLLLRHRPVAAETDGDRVKSVQVRSLVTGREPVLRAPHFIDATELGDLLPLTRTEFIAGSEAKSETGELHAKDRTDPMNQQSFTVCFALDHVAGENHVIARPRDYAFWRDYVPQLAPPWPGRLLSFTHTHPRTLEPRTLPFDPTQDNAGPGMNLWIYRRLIAARNFLPGAFPGDISLVNWPANDFWRGALVGVGETEFAKHLEGAKQLSLSLLHWLQTEAPRADGKTGWPGLRLRPDVVGTEDGMAKYPYVREARRIRALHTIREQECGLAARAALLGVPEKEVTAEVHPDTVGIGHYPIDLHPTTGGDNYVDFDTAPFHLPLGALLPVRVENLVPACKNIGTTHVTNGCYRLHPVEWNIGESAGALAAFAQRKKEPPRAVREKPALLAEFQNWLRDQGVETHWPKGQW